MSTHLSEKQHTHNLQPTLAEVDEGRQRFESDFGVVHPDQKPPESQATLCAHVHTLIILHLQLRHTHVYQFTCNEPITIITFVGEYIALEINKINHITVILTPFNTIDMTIILHLNYARAPF